MDNDDLEYAALAHGGLIYIQDMGWIHEDEHGNRGAWWHPLDNSRDAFDLQVKLRMSVHVEEDGSYVTVECNIWDKNIFESSVVYASGDIYADTRKAIVECAIKIGKKLYE